MFAPALLSIFLGAPPAVPLVDMAAVLPRAQLDIRYATKDNFFHKVAYPEARCLLRPSLAQKLKRAQRWLDAHHPGLVFRFKDCYRPKAAQRLLWDAVKGTKKARYVANPDTKTGSIHSYGAAVDLTLAHEGGDELDMGTPFDFLGRAAEPRHEARLLAAGRLTKAQVNNRKLLRRALLKAGLRMIRNEWWHFNEYPAREVRRRYKALDIPFDRVPGPKTAR